MLGTFCRFIPCTLSRLSENAKLKGLGTVFDCQPCARPRAREGVY